MGADSVQIVLHDFSASHVLFKTCVVESNTEKTLSESDTQAFVYEAFERLPGMPRVPEVHERFSWNGVQYIDLPTVEPWIDDTRNETEKQSRFGIACQAVANALR